MHMGADAASAAGTSSGLPRNHLMSSSTVYFPEAFALRERRAAVRAKLSAMLQERQKQKDTPAVSSQQPWEYKTGAPSAPLKLPKRRKTHWDTLLEEMRWTATDFIEERKWKESSARTLASAVVANGVATLGIKSAKITSGNDKRESGTDSVSKESEMEVDNAEAESDSVADKKRLGLREYISPSTEDAKLTRQAAHTMSATISELWEVISEAGAFSPSDQLHRAARDRVLKLQGGSVESSKGNIEKSDMSTGVDSKREDPAGSTPELNTEGMAKSEQIDTETNIDVTLTSKEKTRAQRTAFYQRITETVSLVSDRIRKRKERRSRKAFEESIALTSEQRKAIEFIEFVWNGNDSAGAVLDGSSGSGKTLVTCSLLWRHRSQGPHLLVCSPARLVRWAHELQRFPGIRVVLFGVSGGISSPNSKEQLEYGPGDVVICEFASLLSGAQSLDLSFFFSISLDSRHPLEALTNPAKRLEGEISAIGQGLARLPSQRLVPSQLLSRSWWSPILRSLAGKDTKRLFVENRGYLNHIGENEVIQHTITQKEQMEFVAAKAAFAIGSATFFDKAVPSVQHKVVSWAKHCLKESNGGEKSTFESVLNHLAGSLAPFVHSMGSVDGDSRLEEESIEWEVRLCPLSQEQRRAYDRCCVGARGGLSLSSIRKGVDDKSIGEACQLAANALMRLRKTCIHGHMRDLLSKTVETEAFSRRTISSMGRIPGIPFARHIGLNVSQPNDDLALEILNGSAKLRELMVLLRDKSNFVIESQVVADALPKETGSARKSAKQTKDVISKVAVLATLPEAQVLTSLLLNAVGFQHKLLVRSPVSSESSASHRTGRTHGVESSVNSVAWVESQIALSEFSSQNDSSPGKNGDWQRTDLVPLGFAACRLVVTSPMTVGADYGGLGIEEAQLVVCLDEDWSGREEYLLQRIVDRCSVSRHRSVQSGKSNSSGSRAPSGTGECQLIKLVSKGTCEESFIASEDSEKEKLVEENIKPHLQWHMNTFGCLSLPVVGSPLVSSQLDTRDSASVLSEHDNLIPGERIIRLRNEELSTILRAEEKLPPNFGSGELARFLPLLSPGGDYDVSSANNSIENCLLRGLLELENLSCFLNPIAMPYAENSPVGPIAARTRAGYVNILPPRPEDIPESVMARHDLTTISSRIYIEKFGQFSLAVMGTAPLISLTSAVQLRFGGANGVSQEVVASDNVDLVDTWHKSVLSCKPGGAASSLLVYSSPMSGLSNGSGSLEKALASSACDDRQMNQVGTAQEQGAKGDSGLKNRSDGLVTTTRSNAYTKLFSCARDGRVSTARDGNQGSEPFVYFPPRFPDILRTAKRLKLDLEHSPSVRVSQLAEHAGGGSTPMDWKIPVDEHATNKRKEVVLLASDRNSKRPRLDASASLGQRESDRSEMRPPTISEAKDIHPNVAAVAGPPGPANLLASRANANPEPSIVTEDEASGIDRVSALLDFGEDYGLLGIGALALPEDSARTASILDMDASTYSNWIDQFGHSGEKFGYRSSFLASDAEDVEAFTLDSGQDWQLESMLLFVSKRAFVSGLGPLHTGAYTSERPITSFSDVGPAFGVAASSASYPPGFMPNGPSTLGNGIGPGKKLKKKGQNQGALAAEMPLRGASSENQRVVSHLPLASLHSGKGKDVLRHKAIASFLGRQGHLGVSLFQSPSFRLASIRLRDRILQRVCQRQPGAGSGLPLSKESYRSSDCTARRKAFVAAVTKLASQDAKTGDIALANSTAERVLLRDSPSFPTRVDFGPFQAGYLALNSGLMGVQPARPRVGVCLPMGVKMSQHFTDHPSQPWTSQEDAILTSCVYRFGFNWYLVATSVNGVDSSFGTQRELRRWPRSARQCHYRWQSLIKLDGSLVMRLLKTVRPELEDAPLLSQPVVLSLPGTKVKNGSKELSLLSTTPPTLTSGEDRKTPEAETKGTDVLDQVAELESSLPALKDKPPRRSFSSFRRAASKKQDLPLAIPGYVAGESKPSLVPSHPSHAQAVQAASSSLSGARAEVWPLQLLDMRDRNSRSTSASAGAAPQTHRGSPARAQQHSRPQPFPSVPKNPTTSRAPTAR